MKAILCERPGTPDELILADLPEPVAEVGQAVVAVEAAALNFFDTLIIAGKYQTKPDFPFSPSAEFAGRIVSLHPSVEEYAVGDRVVGYSGYGAARERVAIDASRLIKLPDALAADRAAGLTVTYGTTYFALKDRARVKEGEMLAVLGAAGGAGLAAVELGKLMGARVIACASSDDKLAFARSYGADDLVNYEKEDLREALKRLSAGSGVDVIYDPVGGEWTEKALRSIAWEGRYLVIGFAAGAIPKLPLNIVLLKNCQVVGVFWGAWTERDPGAHQANMRQLVQWAAEDKLSAHVHARYALKDCQQALKDIAARKVMGKVVLKP